MKTLEDKPKVEKKEKKPKSLFEKLFKTNKLKRPNMVAVTYLRNNGSADMLEIPSRKGFFSINDRTYHEKRDCIYTINDKKQRYPLAIIKEWDIFPVGTKKWDDEPMREKFSELQDHTLRAVRHAEIVRQGGGGMDHKANVKTYVLIFIAIIVIMGVFLGYK